jgi:hypothetical protein
VATASSAAVVKLNLCFAFSCDQIEACFKGQAGYGVSQVAPLLPRDTRTSPSA